MSDAALVLAATPIGNPGDASTRLREALATTDIVAAEDTRRLHRLLTALEVTPRGKVVSFHEHNEAGRAADLVASIKSGHSVLLVTDAGMPSVSDPGYRVVSAAIEAGVPVRVLPGPSAVLAALAVSGLPVDRFAFEGFPPRKPGERARALAALADERRTMVFFEAPHRLGATLAEMVTAFGPDRPAAITRELTKTYEEVIRGPLSELAEWAQGEVLGEITVVVGGAPAGVATIDQLVPEVLGRVADGERMKAVVAEVAAAASVSSKDLYAASLAARATPPA